MLDSSKFKAFAGDKSNVTKDLKFVLERVEIIVGKGGILVTSIFCFSNNAFKSLLTSCH